MKKLYFLLVLLFMLIGFNPSIVEAKTQSVKYTYVKTDKSYHSEKINGNFYCSKVQLSGKSKAIKKIQKVIDKDYKQHIEEIENARDEIIKELDNNYILSMGNMEWYCTASSKVTYNKNGILSIRVKTEWFMGGVSNPDVYGMNFDLNTGKRIYLNEVVEGDQSKVRYEIVKQLSKYSFDNEYEVNKMLPKKLKKYKYYLKNKKAVVCVGPYEINQGGSAVTAKVKTLY